MSHSEPTREASILALAEKDAPEHPWSIPAVGTRVFKVWSCNTCGPSPKSRGDWCDRGCGSDYNKMEELTVLLADPQIIASAMRVIQAARKVEAMLGLALSPHSRNSPQGKLTLALRAWDGDNG